MADDSEFRREQQDKAVAIVATGGIFVAYCTDFPLFGPIASLGLLAPKTGVFAMAGSFTKSFVIFNLPKLLIYPGNRY